MGFEMSFEKLCSLKAGQDVCNGGAALVVYLSIYPPISIYSKCSTASFSLSNFLESKNVNVLRDLSSTHFELLLFVVKYMNDAFIYSARNCVTQLRLSA